ncbi:hypothetical protein Dsin_017930 [Dipteronia sinensis]|uniref:Calmodulin-binding domain-containing protein n=1 Tax=Dipteronia sinensis TaxID=43782 RepID=A0AAE0AG83_9ROSI|nr:hypothetical protein Dsin_017930 [Dipteronia sinensis]
MSTKSTIKRTTSGDSLGKEKRGTSPSNNPNTTNTQKSTFTRSTSDAREKLSSSSSAPAPSLEKQTPNYLKSTISLSSRHDHHHQPSKLNVKKSSTDDQKPLRRRSFDKPPSSSPRVQKALISPPSRPRDRASAAPLAPKERTVTARSSSFSGRSSTGSTAISSRPVLDRSSTSLSSRQSLDGRSSSFAPKTPKAVKSQPVFTSKTTKKSVKTKECNANTSSSTKTLNIQEVEANQENEKECEINNEVGEDTIKVESDETEVHDDHNDDLIPKSEKNEEDDDHDHQIEKVIDEIATISDGHIEEIEDKPHEEEKMEEKWKEIDVVVDLENADDHHHEETTHESGGDQEKEVEGKNSDDHHHEITGDENNKVEEKAHDDQDNGDQVGEGSEELVAKQEAENGNSAAALTANKWPGGQGKKESPTAYNDVIEETASKLLEKRKNKVKALVGAFETVIDYESGASK